MKNFVHSISDKKEKDPSIMQVIPPSHDALMDLSSAYKNLHRSDDFKSLSFPRDNTVTFRYQGESYTALIYKSDVSTTLMKEVHPLSSDVKYRCREASTGLVVNMLFTEDFIKSYHVQLKLLMTLVPKGIAVVDYSSMSLLSGHWARVHSSLPYSEDIYRGSEWAFVRLAVSSYKDKLRVNTFGLKRLLGMELESHHIPSKENQYPELALFECLCEDIIFQKIRIGRNSILEIYPGITLLLEPSIHYFGDTAEPFNRESYSPVEDFFYVSLLKKENDDTLVLPTTHLRDLAPEITAPLFHVSPERFKMISQSHIQIMLDAVGTSTVYANVCGDNYRWMDVHSLEDGTFTGRYLQDGDDMDSRSFAVDDINDWIVYLGSTPVNSRDAFLLRAQNIPVNALLVNDREKLLDKLRTMLAQGESEDVIHMMEHVDVLDLPLTLIYARAFLNMGYTIGAQNYLLREMDLGEDSSQWMCLMASCKRSLYEDDAAESLIERALELDPKNLHAQSEKAALMINQGEFSKASDILNTMINKNEFNLLLSKGEQETIFNMIDHCTYHLEESRREERMRSAQLFFSSGAYRKVVNLLNKETELLPNQRILLSNALYHMGDHTGARRNLNLVEKEFRDESWFRAMESVMEGDPTAPSYEDFKASLREFRKTSSEREEAFFKEMLISTVRAEKFIGIYTDMNDDINLIMHCENNKVDSLMGEFNRDSEDTKLLAWNLGYLLDSYLNDSIECDFTFQHTFRMNYLTLCYRCKNTKKNMDSMNRAADMISDIFTSASLSDIYGRYSQKLSLPQPDLGRVYDQSSPDDSEEFHGIMGDLHNCGAHHEKLELFSSQKNLSEDDIMSYVCALNNLKMFDQAVDLLKNMDKKNMDYNYFNYLFVYGLVGSGEYTQMLPYLDGAEDFITRSGDPDDYDSLLIRAMGCALKDDLASAKVFLSDINPHCPENDFLLSGSLDGFLSDFPDLKDDFYQHANINRCVSLFELGNISEARDHINAMEFTDETTLNKLCNLLVDLEEYTSALKYLNMVPDRMRNENWIHSISLCMILSGDYDGGMESLKEIGSYMDKVKLHLQGEKSSNALHAYHYFMKDDEKSCRVLLLELFDTGWPAVTNLCRMYEERYSRSITTDDSERYKEKRNKYVKAINR